MRISGELSNFKGELGALRRKTVKGSGRFLLRALARFIHRQSLIGDQPVFDKSVFPWVAELEANWTQLRTELESVLESRDDVPCFHEISPDQKRISKGDGWKTFVFYVFGDRFEPNCRRCPHTAAVLARIPDLRNAWFSILSPHYRIPPHHGPTNGVVRIHLGLKVPRDGDSCWIRVDNRILHWAEGECLVFDDFYEHEVQNNTNEERGILFLDVDRPMQPAGRYLNRLLIAAIKRTAYVRDALNNLRQWGQKYPSQRQ